MRISRLNMIRIGFVLCLAVAATLLAVNLSVAAISVMTVATVALVFMVRWHARNTCYVCPQCGHEFRVSAWVDFISPHTFEKKWLSCPSCRREQWCKIV